MGSYWYIPYKNDTKQPWTGTLKSTDLQYVDFLKITLWFALLLCFTNKHGYFAKIAGKANW